MTKADLVEEVAHATDLTRKDSEVIVDTLFESVIKALRAGDKLEVRGFGSFRVRERNARVGRNPKTRREGRGASQARTLFQAQQRAQGSDQPKDRFGWRVPGPEHVLVPHGLSLESVAVRLCVFHDWP